MPRPTLEKVMKVMEGFSYELQMYCYHKLNGRDDEALSYLEAYKEEQEAMRKELEVINDENN